MFRVVFVIAKVVVLLCLCLMFGGWCVMLALVYLPCVFGCKKQPHQKVDPISGDLINEPATLRHTYVF